MFGKLLGSIVRIVNAPIRAAEDVLTCDQRGMAEDERILSNPLDALADQLDDIDKDD